MTNSPSPASVASAPPGPRWHERRSGDGGIRAPWDALSGTLQDLDLDDLRVARAEADRLLADDGVSYQVPGRPNLAWHLDPIPLAIGEGEWTQIETGVQQRAELLNLILADVYGPQELLRSGAIPAEAIFGHPGHLHPLHEVRNPGHRQLVTCATDLVRDANGSWRALADRTQSPSGASYALANRSVMSRVLGEEQRDAQVLRLAPYLRALRSGLRRLAPGDVDDPRVVVLTSGSEGETSYEHAALASALGVPLVEGSDLAVRGGRLQLRSLDRLEPVDVVLRRVDADWCDPLELRPDSTLGVPGLVEAARRGTVAIANPLGAAVLENGALLSFLPALSKELLGQPLHLEPVRTWWCGDPDQREHVLANLETLVIKPVQRGRRHLAGWELSASQRHDVAERIRRNPIGWVGQEALAPSLVPSLDPSGNLTDAAALLRTFVVADEDGFVAMPGGLTRVDAPDRLAVTNATGAWSKDTWIVSGREERLAGFWYQEGPTIIADPTTAGLSARAADNLFWLGRYAERAEATVRLLRVIEDRRTDFGGRTGPVGTATVDVMLQTLTQVTTTWPGFTGPVGAALREHPTEELTALVLDTRRHGTLAHSVQRLLTTAQAVRDRLSGDTWPVTNALHREVLGNAPAIVDSHGRPTQAGLGRVLTGLLALQGLGSESLERDPTWHFIEVGRRLERALQLLALLRASLATGQPAAIDSLVWESVLTSAESIITYRRRYRSRAQLPTLLDLLLLDDANPRSVAWQLERLVEALRQIPGHPGAGEVGLVEQAVVEAVTALRVSDTSRLAQPDAQGQRAELTSFLDHLRLQLQGAADLLFQTALAQPLAPRATLAPSAPAASVPPTSAGGKA